jgi:hypothetical protein
MKYASLLILVLAPLFMSVSACASVVETNEACKYLTSQEDTTTGYACFFMGHSFFIPVARSFNNHPVAAGFSDHSQVVYQKPGNSGTPAAMWNNITVRSEIQTILDTGSFDLVGMTFHSDYPSAEGYLKWVGYALQQNPDTRFFIGMPWVRYPDRQSASEMEEDYSFKHNEIVHKIIDTLRLNYPQNEFFCIPYGMASITLKGLYENNNLQDVSQLIGDPDSSVYTDQLGHAGEILRTFTALIWLSAIYDVDLQNYNHSTGYNTDLKVLSKNILHTHDTCYDFWGSMSCDTTLVSVDNGIDIPSASVRVFPNPSSHEVSFDLSLAGLEQSILELSIMDISGKVIEAKPIIPGEIVKLSALSKGTYIYHIFYQGDRVKIGKIVIQ